ncbi:hypothetical protein J437_LFUL001177 [Ladona fulva]|uniref:Glutamate-rich protein 2 n=1 Tax=Ladona fulva TaxID=123851 RepID=A0A8K0JZT0_LADFU|nr:hypothetical protein J437_LFUL001177 [Ladona fulva]
MLLPSSSTVLTPRSSSEDLSEYTDADESISAPTEFLAEFLSAVMMRDFTTALKYCKLILQYEPNNATAKEFYPLILEKLKSMSDENDTSSESSASEDNSDAISVSGEKHNNEDSDATTASYSSLEDEEVDSKGLGVNEAANLSQVKYTSETNGNSSCLLPQPLIRQHKGSQQQQEPAVSSFVISSSDSESPTEPISQQLANV